MTLGKIHSLVLASIFAVALVASDDGDLPSGPVFWCLSEASHETFKCYKHAYSFSSSHLAGSLGTELKTLVIKHYEGWKQLQDNLRGRACVTALKNFLGPLREVLRSESISDHVCQYSGKKLNETLAGLVEVIRTTVFSIRGYVDRHRHVSLRGSAQVQHVNMTRMTNLAAHQIDSQSHHTAVSLRNFVLLELLKQAMRDIYESEGCFNTELRALIPCPAGHK